MVDYLVAVALFITSIRIFSKLTKLWRRRENINVTQSISIVSCTLGIIVAIPVMIRLVFLDQSYLLAINVLIPMLGSFVQIAIGVGYWISENKNTSAFILFFKALGNEILELKSRHRRK